MTRGRGLVWIPPKSDEVIYEQLLMGAISFWQKLFVLHLLTVASKLFLVGSKGELIEVFGKWSLAKRWGVRLIYMLASSQMVSLVSWRKYICAASLLIGNEKERFYIAFRCKVEKS